MTRALLLGGAAMLACSGLVVAQDAPESLLPPGFDDPAPAPRPSPAPSVRPAPGQTTQSSGSGASPTITTSVIQELPGLPSTEGLDLSRLPTLEELEAMSTDELDDLLGLKPKFDIPNAARRDTTRVGILGAGEGGFASASFSRQPASLVTAVLAGTKGPLVSRWGHILLRRALASRLAAPEGMDPIEFAGLRARVLVQMGEYAAARAIAQDIDTANWNDTLTDAALEAYIGEADIVGSCPAVRLQGGSREDAQWQMLQAICDAYAGEETRGNQQLTRALSRGIAPRIDVLLAQRYAGAAGNGRRAVDIEWDDVQELTPWRFALANAVGAEIPENLRTGAGPYYQRIWATAPMLGLPLRAEHAFLAAERGILSARAIVDLYSQIYADDEITGEPALVSTRLREAYVGEDPDDRIAAIEDIWGGAADRNYGRMVLTAYAAARIPANEDYAGDAGMLLTSMLAAGLDRDAALWANAVKEGSLGWALVALATPGGNRRYSNDEVDAFFDDDNSAEQRKSRFLVAGLAGLGRLENGVAENLSGRLGVSLTSQTKWIRMIERAAEADNPALVVLLAGLGMQGDGWDRMTARHLYFIVSSLRRVGLDGEARMIAAEAVARA